MGHVLSQDGGNMPNILNKKQKSIGTQKLIPKLIKNLGSFTFEGGMIYLQSLLRTSILYGSETMFNITEKEFRIIESIEESVLQNIFHTKRSCSRHLLYLESGILPARYQIHRQMMNFLQYLLLQPINSLLYRVFIAQKINPTKGDWVSNVLQLLINYNINMNLQDIKNMKTSIFKNLVKKKVQQAAFESLILKKIGGTKGSKIHYNEGTLQMSHYLLAQSNISVTDKEEIFSYRCEMNDLPFNFGRKTNCELGCSIEMNNEHLLNCPILNQHNGKMEYNQILNGTNNQKISILRKLQENDKRRKLLMDSV